MLREGNSDRRAPASVKQYARKHPHSMGVWSTDSKTQRRHTWQRGDFRSNEQSTTVDRAVHRRASSSSAQDGAVTVLKEPSPC